MQRIEIFDCTQDFHSELTLRMKIFVIFNQETTTETIVILLLHNCAPFRHYQNELAQWSRLPVSNCWNKRNFGHILVVIENAASLACQLHGLFWIGPKLDSRHLCETAHLLFSVLSSRTRRCGETPHVCPLILGILVDLWGNNFCFNLCWMNCCCIAM